MADIILRQGQSLPEGTLTRYQDQGDGTHALVVATGAVAGGSDVTDRADRLLGRTTNYDVAATGTLDVLKAVVTLSTAGLGTAGIGITGTWVGTILAEGSVGNGVWNTIPLVDAMSGDDGLSTTANGNFFIGVAGYLNVRLRVNVYTSGAAVVRLEGSRMVTGMFLTRSIPFGLNTIGNVLVTSQIPGVGATNLGKAEDALHASGHTGVMALSVRNDTRTSFGDTDLDYVPQSMDDEGRTLVVATGNKLNIALTPTITAGAYTAGDALGGLLTFGGAAAVAAGRGTITKVVIVDDDNELQPIDLVLFNQTFTPTADNDPFAPSEADLENCIGHISIAATDYASFSANAVATKRNVGFDYTVNGTSLFGQMVIRDVGGYAATDDLTVKITVILD